MLLIARQRWAGEGDFYIFAPPGRPVLCPPGTHAPIAPAPIAPAPPAKQPMGADQPKGAEQLTDEAAQIEDRNAEDGDAAAESTCDSSTETEREQAARAATVGSDDDAYDAQAVEAFICSIRDAEPEALPVHTAAYRGCVAAGWVGLQFIIYDGGVKAAQANGFPFPEREEVATVTYASNILKTRPHALSMTVLDCAEAEAAAEAGREAGGEAGGEAGAKAGGEASSKAGDEAGDSKCSARLGRPRGPLADQCKAGAPGVHKCKNVLPEWDESLQAYTLPFYQRVVLPSKKNVHIVQPHAPDDIVLLFGKRAKNYSSGVTTFSLDYCRPISCLVAFGIALTSFYGSN